MEGLWWCMVAIVIIWQDIRIEELKDSVDFLMSSPPHGASATPEWEPREAGVQDAHAE